MQVSRLKNAKFVWAHRRNNTNHDLNQFSSSYSVQVRGDYHEGIFVHKFGNLVAAFALSASGSAVFADNIDENNFVAQTSLAASIYDTNSWQRLLAIGNGSEPTVWKAACCKVCRKGKACGNSCISRSYTCRKGRGCACDG